MNDIRSRIYNTFLPADILLPPRGADMSRWSVIACDQFTSEPEYWHGITDFVGEAPSTLHCILPEAFLADAVPSTVMRINTAMRNYLYNYLESAGFGMIYVERTLPSGGVRRGIVCAVDLEEYDYKENTDVLIRATEATVVSRIPARVRIRAGACVELPHSMLLVDDAQKTVVEPAAHGDDPIYDFELSGGGGRIKGYGLDADECERVRRALSALADGNEELFFAVGDGNHSLAAAKSWWEHLRANLPETEKKTHPARFALTEIVNLHDETLGFEPIYRIVGGCDPEAVIAELRDFAASASCGYERRQSVTYVTNKTRDEITFESAPHSLTVGSLGIFLDAYAEKHPELKIDYIHGRDALVRLVDRDDEIGFLFDGMKKSELFSSVKENGVLPRKAFSMGEARDKRYYVEARRIKNDGELVV